MATRAAPKKVRLACRRCRSRRIKCDGQVPACSNCAKAGEPCLDVDSQNSHLLIPRNFASAARARIQWLEDIIRSRVPDVDLGSGPQVDGGLDMPRTPEPMQREPGEPPGVTATPSPDALTHHRSSLKRPADSGEPFSEKAHSVAMNLGLLSLNSDSSQKAYLGSSSGLLFATLVCASPSSNPSSAAFTHDSADGPAPDLLLDRQVYVQSRYRSLHYMLRQELPKYEDAVLLLQTYIRWIHPDYPILDPASLHGALAALYSCSSCDLNEEPLIPDGWPGALEPFQWNGKVVQPGHTSSECPPMPVLAFILFMIFNLAAIIKVRSRVYEYSPERYYRLAIRFSGDCFSQISLASIQALSLLIVHCLHTPAEPSFWTLVHVGMAHCIELGLHREPQPGSSDNPAFQQVKRLVFYTLYGLDRSISAIQGRPIGFRDESFDIKLPETGTEHSNVSRLDTSLFGADDLGYVVFRFELDQIVSDIKMRLYLLPSKTSEVDIGDAADSQEEIRRTLIGWHDRINAHGLGNPGSLEGRQKYIWSLKLQVRYHTTMILLFQPSQRIPSPSQDSLQIVYNSASVILRSYELLHKNHGLHHGWRPVQNIFAAGAALVYSFWTSELVQSRASPTELSRSLRSCSSLLSVGGEWWPSVKTSLASFGSVVDLTIQKLYMRGPATKQARLGTSSSVRDVALEQGESADNDARPSLAGEPNSASSPATWATYGHAQQDPGLGQIGLQTPSQQWRDGHTYTPMAQEVASQQELMPEIEHFLADFGRSDFSWSFPLGDIEEGLDTDAFMDP